MHVRFYGFVSLIVAGLLHTLERIAAKIATGIAWIGIKGGIHLDTEYPSLFENFFVVIFLVIGIGLFIYDFIQHRTNIKRSTK